MANNKFTIYTCSLKKYIYFNEKFKGSLYLLKCKLKCAIVPLNKQSV